MASAFNCGLRTSDSVFGLRGFRSADVRYILMSLALLIQFVVELRVYRTLVIVGTTLLLPYVIDRAR